VNVVPKVTKEKQGAFVDRIGVAENSQQGPVLVVNTI